MASRWQVKQEEREGAQERSLTPFVPTPQPRTETEGQRRGRGSGVRNRQYELPDYLAPSPISTPSRGGTAGRGVRPKAENPAVPPKAALDPNGSNGSRGENRSGVTPVNGSFRKAVEQGPDGKVTPNSGNAGGAQSTNSDDSGYIAPSSGSQRTNPNGLVSYGKDLSSLNQFTREFTGGYEVADIKSAFQSEDLPTAYQTGSNTISTEQTSYELPEGAAPSPLNQGLAGTSDLKISDSGYTIGEASVPNTVGRTGDAQEGSSAKPDIAEEVRTIRMRRKGPRDDGGFAWFQY